MHVESIIREPGNGLDVQCSNALHKELAIHVLLRSSAHHPVGTARWSELQVFAGNCMMLELENQV